MNPLLRLTLIAAALTLLAVVAYHLSTGSGETGWEALAVAQDPAPTVESLENARDVAGSTDAAPWIDYRLALALYDRAEPGDFERAVQVADETLARYPDHVVAGPLRHLVEAVASYPGAGA